MPCHVVEEVANLVDQRVTGRQSISISVMVSILCVVRLTFTVLTGGRALAQVLLADALRVLQALGVALGQLRRQHAVEHLAQGLLSGGDEEGADVHHLRGRRREECKSLFIQTFQKSYYIQ